MNRRHTSALGADLAAAADGGTAEVVELASRRHAPVRGTRLPHRPAPSQLLDVASLALRGATALSEAHDTDDDEGRASYAAEGRALIARALASLDAHLAAGRT